jgi:hypothetical protein
MFLITLLLLAIMFILIDILNELAATNEKGKRDEN